MRRHRRKGEKPTHELRVRRAPETTDCPPPQNSGTVPTFFLYMTSDRTLLSTGKDELYPLSL